MPVSAAAPAPAPDAVRLPGSPLGAFRRLERRMAIAGGIVLAVALIAYLQRDGYYDAGGGGLSLLDAFYYATVSVSTTGYGDVVPRSDSARLVATVVITPLRLLFLIVLVGTTIEILTERTRHVLRIRAWSRTLTGHTVICGFGTKGRSAISLLEGKGLARERVVVIDSRPDAVEQAASAGYAAIHGDASQTSVLRQARIEEATAVVVAPDRDDAAVLITLTARELNPRATIAAAVREEENAHLLRRSGATAVVTTSGAAGRILGLATQEPAAVEVLEDLLGPGHGIDIAELEVPEGDAGAPPQARDGAIVLAVVRDGEILRFDDPRAAKTQSGDRLVCVVAHPRRGRG